MLRIFIFANGEVEANEKFQSNQAISDENAHGNFMEGTTTKYELVLEMRAHENVNMINDYTKLYTSKDDFNFNPL